MHTKPVVLKASLSFWPNGWKEGFSDLCVLVKNTDFWVEQKVLFDLKCSGFACVYKYRKCGSKGLGSQESIASQKSGNLSQVR